MNKFNKNIRVSLTKILLISILYNFVTVSYAQHKPSQQWLDQKYSMFIHFGLYSAYGGVYDGKPVKWGYSEQIQTFAGIFSDWYAEKAQEFNPVNWDADNIVSLAKNAGMKSIVLTSKHHDGFCMYNSKYTDYDVVDATPYKKDVLKSLADACKKADMRLGIYFSLIDWHFPQAYPYSSHNTDFITPEHHQYNLKQVEELMTNYGKISEIWFDMGSLTPAQSKELYDMVNRLQPECMISGRLGNDLVDFAVMGDNKYPDYKLSIPWQTAASMFEETWGYRSWQQRGKVDDKVREKLLSFIKVISRGGNYLLNIGPRGDGSVVEFEKEVLEKMGKWINVNKEAIYGTHANPLHNAPEWGDITSKDNDLFLFVEKFRNKIQLNNIQGKIDKIVYIAQNKNLKYAQKGNTIEISLDENDDILPVIKVFFKNGYTTTPDIVKNKTLSAYNAQNQFAFSSINYYAGYKSLTSYNWNIESKKNTINPRLYFTESEKNREITLKVDDDGQTILLNSNSFMQKSTPKNSVFFGDLYVKRGGGLFGDVKEEHNTYTEPKPTEWKKIDNFEYGKQQIYQLNPRQSIVLLQEISSSCEQEIAMEIGGGNAVYILLNGKYVTAHFSTDRLHSQKEILILPLKKGKNQLVIKHYNGFEKELVYSITPLNNWKMYFQNVPSISFDKSKNIHQISLHDAHPSSMAAPLRMNNVKIELK